MSRCGVRQVPTKAVFPSEWLHLLCKVPKAIQACQHHLVSTGTLWANSEDTGHYGGIIVGLKIQISLKSKSKIFFKDSFFNDGDQDYYSLWIKDTLLPRLRSNSSL